MGGRLAYAAAVGSTGHRRESRGSTVDVGGLELTPVARESAVGVRLGPAAAFAARVAPSKIELRGPDGRTQQIRVTDIHWRMRVAGATLVALLAAVTLLGRLR